ncbi:50S ribosomal protein L6 [Candidatus Woesearchaeota archaeon]|nr:50S ribosomal protein L6 [Candidatus Woesearchaeota archaeon]
MIEARRLRKEIQIPAGIDVELGEKITVKKGKYVVSKKLSHPTLEITKEGDKLIITPKGFTKREKKIINTFKSHLDWMLEGVEEPFVYQVKICSSHFPMNVTIEGKKIIVKNFLGEKVPRKTEIEENVEVKMEGDVISITSPDKEAAGQTAANCERCTRITNKDRRVFQDGLWIIKKAERNI